MKALFPISLNNTRFNSEGVVFAYNNIKISYSKVVFIIADQLQLYNKALRVNGSFTISDLINDFNAKTNYYSERKVWLGKLKLKVNNPNLGKWDIFSINNITDNKTFKIFRNILIAFYSDDSFSKDIKDYINDFVLKKRNNEYSFEKNFNLSIGYLLEEIALNIRLKVIDGITDEYYLGEYALPILKLFNNEYNFSVFDIAEVINKNINFIFYIFKPEEAIWINTNYL